ncbi:MAG: hypothetical protein QM723_40625 [Myxococcaceae bacterium]
MHRTEADANVSNKFDEGDPMVPRLPTQIAAVDLNAWQEEIAGVVEAAGITLQTAGTDTFAQLLAALRTAALFAQNAAPFKGSAHAGAVRCRMWPGADGTNGTRLDITINAAWNSGSSQWVPDVSTSPSLLLRMAAGASGSIIPASANIQVFRNDSGAAFAESAWSPLVNGTHGLSFATHWSNNGAPHPDCAYQVGIDGQVRLWGCAINDGTLGDVATLPAGVRPLSTLILPARYYDGTDWFPCYVQIDTAGVITAHVPSPASLVSARLLLNGITFQLGV